MIALADFIAIVRLSSMGCPWRKLAIQPLIWFSPKSEESNLRNLCKHGLTLM